jgi:hypothetical protein
MCRPQFSLMNSPGMWSTTNQKDQRIATTPQNHREKGCGGRFGLHNLRQDEAPGGRRLQLVARFQSLGPVTLAHTGIPPGHRTTKTSREVMRKVVGYNQALPSSGQSQPA